MARSTTRRNGQGSVSQRKDGRWEGAITIGYNEKGNPIRARVIKATQAEAADELNKIITKKNLGIPLNIGKQTLETFIATWLRDVIKPSSTPKTYRYYEQLTRLYIVPKLGRKNIDTITAQHVQAMLNELAQPRTVDGEVRPPLKPHSLNGVRATLRSCLNTARQWQLIHNNPVSLVKPPKREYTEPIYLEVEEMKALVKKLPDHPYGNLIAVGLFTGMRLGEATGLRWEDVDFEDQIIRVRKQLQFTDGQFVLSQPKSASGRRNLPLTDTLPFLTDQRENQALWKSTAEHYDNRLDLVFTTPEGKPLHQKNVDKALKALVESAGIKKPISFHKLRHTHATHLAAKGVSLALVKDQLGHSQISVTMNQYSHAVPTALRSASVVFGDLFREKANEAEDPASDS